MKPNLPELRELLAKATPGPFHTKHVAGDVWSENGRFVADCHSMILKAELAESHANAELFAALRNNASALLEAAEREQQRDVDSASASNSRPDRASGDGGRLDVVQWLAERMANCQRIALTKSGADKAGWLEDAGYLRAAIHLVADAAVGQDASPKPEQNNPNAVREQQLREALAELVRLHELLLTADPQHLARMPTYIKQVINDPAWSAARALLEGS